MRNERITKRIISPPFGNYLTFLPYTCVKGSYTSRQRKGLLKQVIKTLRYTKDGWINAIGLRNVGIDNIKIDDKSVIYSFALAEGDTWDEMVEHLIRKDVLPDLIELNLGCPNTSNNELPSEEHIKILLNAFPFVSLKLPASEDAYGLFTTYYKYGVRVFHCCNTIKTDKGGLSGRKIQDVSLELIYKIRKNYPIDDYTIIGGGGIYSKEDEELYKLAGGDHFSVSTAFLNPFSYKYLFKGS